LIAIGQAELDKDTQIALVLSRHAGYRPADFGYLNGDYILFDLVNRIDTITAEISNARARAAR
jgi:hypothetical protein